MEIKLGDNEYVYGPFAGIHFTTKSCPKCEKIKDVEIHHLPPSLGMSEKEIKKNMRKESKEEYCHSLSHKPWFWGATAGVAVLLAVIGIVVYFWWKSKNKEDKHELN